MMKAQPAFNFWKNQLNGARYVVAPMVDQSELPWRMLCRKYGSQLCYSPMYHAVNFLRDAHYRREALSTCSEDRPFIIQFCANDPDALLEAAKIAQKYCDAIDLNLGCPQSIAKRGHYGAFLQDEWDLVTQLIKKCAENLTVPITCKIRIFESIEKTVKYAQTIERAGCQLLAVHGRTREQKGLDTGLASWEHIKAIRENVNIPVFANGNIQYVGDIERCIRDTGVAGVMVAESNLHNPALFAGETPPCWEMVEEYLSLVDKYPCSLTYVRGHVFKLNHHALQRHTDIRDEFSAAKSLECYKLANVKLKERCLLDANKSCLNTDVLTEHNLPYWICQPYVRPVSGSNHHKPVNHDKYELLKRPFLETFKDIDIDLNNLSYKKMKRMLRHPHKIYQFADPPKLEKCSLCDNIKGSRCSHDLCRCCCRMKTSREVLDCEGHKFLFKTRATTLNLYEAKVIELSKTLSSNRNGDKM